MSKIAELEILRRALLDDRLTQIGDTPLTADVKLPLPVTPRLSVRVFNRADDKDDEAVFGKNGHIAFDLQSAWVKYTLAVKAGDRASAGIAAAQMSGDVQLSDYRIHDAAAGAWDAIRQDLESPRTLLSLDDVRALKPGEALTMELGGAMSASVTMSWSDVIGARLADIVDGLMPRIPFAVKLRTGLEATAAVKVTDHFSVVISRTRDGYFRIAVQKAKSRNHTFGIDVTFGAELSAAPALDEALEALFESLGPEGEREEAAAAALKKELRSRLVDAVRWKAATGFAYDYARIDESTAIADFILRDETRLAGDYELAMAGDFAKLADALRQDPQSRELVRYLNETSLTRRSSSGFSLGPLRAKDTSVFELTTRTALDGYRMIAARGTRRYDEQHVPGSDFEWTVGLKAQTDAFLAAPVSRDFDYGLHYSVTSANVPRMLDLARMWGVQPPPPPDAAATVKLELLFEREELLAALAAFRGIEEWAVPLAMAMPYDGRLSFEERRDAYTAAWRAWLAGARPAALPPGLARQFEWASGEGHPQLRRRLDAFMRGAGALHECMTTAAPPERIGDAYDGLEMFWSQRLYIAAGGRYLLDRGYGVATLKIETGDATITSTAGRGALRPSAV